MSIPRTVLILFVTCLSPVVAHCKIAEIIDSTGDGTNALDGPNLTVDGSGNVYVTGINSDNAFRIAASTACSTVPHDDNALGS